MKHVYLLLLLVTTLCIAQPQPYYDSIDFNGLTGQNLNNELAQLISSTADANYTYGEVRNDFLIMEVDPSNTDNVLLTYGWVNSLSCTSGINDRRIRDKNNFGGNLCQYNREHVFARSNANPGMGDTSNGATGIVADPHNLRATDVQRNGIRNSKRFASGSGNSGDVGSGNWYPGDEWRGDVARIMMYMYVRYGDRCLPELNAVGAKQGSTDMLQILLQWNADDPVSQIEDNRNNQLALSYGNRNPFIDNPYLATLIWGGQDAEDRWGTLSIDNLSIASVKLYPNPTRGNDVTILSNESILAEVYDILGKKVTQQSINANQKKLDVSGLKNGIYIVRLKTNTGTITKKLIKQ